MKSVPALIKLLLACDFLLGGLFLIGSIGFLPDFIYWRIHLDAEANISAWYSSIQLCLVGILFGVFTIHERSKEKRLNLALAVSSLLFLFLSMDEISGLHEKLGLFLDRQAGIERADLVDNPNGLFSWTGGWMLWLAPLLLSAFVFIGMGLRPYMKGCRPATEKLFVGVALFFISATQVELLANVTYWMGGFAHACQLFTEEVGEMAGITLVAWGVLQLMAHHHVTLDFAQFAARPRAKRLVI